MSDQQAFHVNVTVSDGTIVCSPDPVKVTYKNAKLNFRLQTAGYTFPTSNAVVVTNPEGEFPRPSHTVDPQTVTLHDNCTYDKTYEYTVTVIDSATGKPLVLDPTIRNELV